MPTDIVPPVTTAVHTAGAESGRTDDPHPVTQVRDRGQATTEYALVLLAAALVGLLVIAWATSGGGAAAVGRLFDRVIQSVIDKV
jgi:hypothetical protein